jgi:hypothetical protein
MVGAMKRIPMSPEARRKDAVRRRKLTRARRMTVVALAIVTTGMWAYILLTN